MMMMTNDVGSHVVTYQLIFCVCQTLLHGLSDELKLSFLELALSCKAVICCRLGNILLLRSFL